MLPEVENLVYKVRKEIYNDLKRGKEIAPKGYFFVRGQRGAIEIMIPGIEGFVENAQTIALLPRYIQFKWNQYKGKANYELLAVMVMADTYVVTRNVKDLTDEQAERRARSIVVRHAKDKIDVIYFFIYTPSKKKGYKFPYYREGGGRIRWGDPIEDINLVAGTLWDMFPKEI